MNERTFFILPVSQLDKVDFKGVLETSPDTLRRSVDGTKTFVKWEGDQPLFINDIVGGEGPYTYSEIIDILNTPEWTNFELMG